MRLLIAIKSCQEHRLAGHHGSILNTWGKDVPSDVDLRFFIGDAGRFEPKSDQTVCLGCPDEYAGLPRKTKAILGWSLWNGYDYTFLCDTDTFVIPNHLLRCGFESWDYSGRFGPSPQIGTTFEYRDEHQTIEKCHPWASGGIGYFLSRKAAELVARSWPTQWAEDLHVGQVLGPHIQAGEITAADIPDFECNISWHFPQRKYRCKYDPRLRWMETMYNDSKA